MLPEQKMTFEWLIRRLRKEVSGPRPENVGHTIMEGIWHRPLFSRDSYVEMYGIFLGLYAAGFLSGQEWNELTECLMERIGFLDEEI